MLAVLSYCYIMYIGVVVADSYSEFDDSDVKENRCFRNASSFDFCKPLVNIRYGFLQGFCLNALNGRLYSGFTRVPYAAKPVKELRFELPQPVTPWSGLLDASQPTLRCIQYSVPVQNASLRDISKDPLKMEYVTGVEDCLYMNIYSPKLVFEHTGSKIEDCNICPPSGCPVIVYLHGGAYRSDGAQVYGGKYLMQTGKVILAVINSRVGTMGFMSTEDEVLPGNLGLKDNVYALQFIKDNIDRFGGDPNMITLAGGSSGSSTVHLMNMSPLGKGLFQQSIAMSGTFLNTWAMQKNAKQNAHIVAKNLGCPTSSSRRLVDCLKTKDAADIVVLTQLFLKTQWPATPISTFAPVFNEPCGDTAFLSDNPFHILTNGDFESRPIIVSLAQHEGLFPAAIMILHDDIMAELNDRWIEVAPYLLDYNSSVMPNKRDDLSHLIKQFYFHNEKISVKNGDKLIQMMGDRHFSGDIGRAALLHAFYSFSDIYVAMFSYGGKNSVTKILSGTDINFGASHTDDVCYIMNTPYLNPEETQSDRDMIKRYVDMFTSFAYTGKPDFGSDVNWRRQSPFGFFISRLNFLEIHSPYKFTSNYIYNYANMSFWNSLPIYEPGNGRFFK